MAEVELPIFPSVHSHVFLSEDHQSNERRTWAVIALCACMMVAEIVGGVLFGSLALVADGLHMSTHAGALLLAALAYSFARRHAHDPHFSFGTGKLGDLAGFTSAIILAMIALLIGYEAVDRFISPVPIHDAEAIPIAVLGLAVNIASVLLLRGAGHRHHGHGHAHGDGHRHGHDHHQHSGAIHDEDGAHRIEIGDGRLAVEIFEDGVPPRFRLRVEGRAFPEDVVIETERANGARQAFSMRRCDGYLESINEIPEPHDFAARIRLKDAAGTEEHEVVFEEHAEHALHAAERDNNMRAALIHVIADATVSVLVIVGLLLARFFGWAWMDPLVGVIGALVIMSWSYGLVRDTGAILLDMTPDRAMAEDIRAAIEAEGDRLGDLHLWRLGPGHLGAIVSVLTQRQRGQEFYRRKLARFPSLSHLTIEVHRGA
jgi:cation diffusion facilitator family transporter